jgi:hypothetical protein
MTPSSHLEIPVKPETEQPSKPQIPTSVAPEINPRRQKVPANRDTMQPASFFNPP